tara:strand:+ start:27123 stop:28301 length:1179 start_codon:yes stop_codon:yes gene_type:complete
MHKKDNIDILVLSTACHTAINRKIYKLFELDEYSIILVCPRYSYFNNKLEPSEAPRDEDPRIIFDDINTKNQRLSNFKNIRKIIKKYKPKNIIIDNDPGSLMTIFCRLYSFYIPSKIYCITCENLDLTLAGMIKRRGFHQFVNIFLKKLLLMISRFCINGLFVINKNGLQVFNKVNYKNIKQIPLGYDPDYFYVDNNIRNKFRISHDINKFSIGFLGRIVEEKGLHILIDALNDLKHLEWVLVLDEFSHYQSKYADDINAQIKKFNIDNRILRIDPTHEDMAKYMNMLDLIVIPSLSTPVWEEQYGRIAAEAMACGTNVVVSDTGHLPDLVSDYGYLFTEGNVQELCYIIEGFLNGTIDGHSQSVLEGYAVDQLSTIKQKKLMEKEIFGSNK